MTFALIEAGEIAEWPLTRERIAEIMATAMETNGTQNATVTLPRSLNGLDLAEFDILPVATSERPTVLPGQQAVEAAPALIGSTWTQQWTVEGDLAAVKAAMLAALASRRYDAEIAGTTVGGVPLATDRATRSILTAAYVKASQDSEFAIPNWKVANGVYVTLDAATIIAAGDAATAYVQLCFDNEVALSAQIEAAEDFEALAAIDLETGWPE